MSAQPRDFTSLMSLPRDFYLHFSIVSTFESKCFEFYWILRLQMKTLLSCWDFVALEMFRDTQNVLQRGTKPQKNQSGVQKSCVKLFGTGRSCITKRYQSFFLNLQRVHTLKDT